MTEFKTLDPSHPALRGRMSPPLMAIGDSIFNGTRSLTTSGPLAKASPPAVVAAGLGLSAPQFVIPNYPRPVLADFEEQIRQGLNIDRIIAAVVANAEAWMHDFAAAEAAVHGDSPILNDNLAIAGATYDDLRSDRAGPARDRAAQAFSWYNTTKDPAKLIDVYMNVNKAFVLNPSCHPDLDDLSPIELVASRKPQRLLINIGSNDGLFTLAITGKPDDEARATLGSIDQKALDLGELLAEHCADVGKIYVNLLIKPRALANLEHPDMFEVPLDGRYFDRYFSALLGGRGFTAAEMRDLDDEVQRINRQTQRALSRALGDKVVFVDLYELADRHDAKHYGNARAITLRDGAPLKRVTNRPFRSLVGARGGGMFSLDNMHLTTVGYALLGNTIGAVIAEAEGVPFTPADYTEVAKADTLLTNPPRAWDVATALVRTLGSFGLFGTEEDAETPVGLQRKV